MADTFTNPIIRGFYPDPSICRKGDDFYLTTTTQEFFPALPVFHSRNLADWKQIGHVISNPQKLNLDTAEDGQGVTAPTLRYYDGVFFVVSTLIRHDPKAWFIKSFICTATDPAGPWDGPHFIERAKGIDPSLFKDDDGKVYYHGNNWVRPAKTKGHREIWMQEFDLKSLTLKSERKVLLDAEDWVDVYGEEGCVSFDGPHIYKKNGWYYLIIAAGDTHWYHSMLAFCSKNVWGPYEPCPDNPIMTHRDQVKETGEFTCIGHLDLIDTPGGDWWGVFLGTRPYAGCYNYLGRETFLAPVDWSGDWPKVSPKTGRIEKRYNIPLQLNAENAGKAQRTQRKNRDNFDTNILGMQYLFIRRPQTQWWNLQPGKLRINLREPMLHEVKNPSFIGQRIRDMEFKAETEVVFDPTWEYEEAGLALYKGTNAYFRLVLRITQSGLRNVCLIKRLTQDDRDFILVRAQVPDRAIVLRIDTENRRYRSSWKRADSGWNVLDNTFDVSCLSQTVVGGYTGILVGMFAGSNGRASKNYADFSFFEYKETDE